MHSVGKLLICLSMYLLMTSSRLFFLGFGLVTTESSVKNRRCAPNSNSISTPSHCTTVCGSVGSHDRSCGGSSDEREGINTLASFEAPSPYSDGYRNIHQDCVQSTSFSEISLVNI